MKGIKDEYGDILKVIVELRNSGVRQVPDTLIADKTGLDLYNVRERLELMRKEGQIILCDTDKGYTARTWDRVTS